MKRLNSLISPIIKGFGMEEAVKLEEIKRDWTQVFRAPLCSHMSPLNLKNGELLVNVDSPIWLQQLTFLKTEIIGNLRPYGVKDMRFRVGRIMHPDKRPGRHEKACREMPPVGGEEVRRIDAAVSVIKDGALKESIRRAMSKSFVAKVKKS